MANKSIHSIGLTYLSFMIRNLKKALIILKDYALRLNLPMLLQTRLATVLSTASAPAQCLTGRWLMIWPKITKIKFAPIWLPVLASLFWQLRTSRQTWLLQRWLAVWSSQTVKRISALPILLKIHSVMTALLFLLNLKMYHVRNALITRWAKGRPSKTGLLSAGGCRVLLMRQGTFRTAPVLTHATPISRIWQQM